MTKTAALVVCPSWWGGTRKWACLVRRWEQSKAGLGQVVLLSGEAGLGNPPWWKLRRRCARSICPRIAFRCSPYHTNTALYPVLTHLVRLLRFERHDPRDEARQA